MRDAGDEVEPRLGRPEPRGAPARDALDPLSRVQADVDEALVVGQPILDGLATAQE